MINKNTVLILGAGASIPYGFPGGMRLKAEICASLLNPSDYLESGFSESHISDFQQHFTHSPQESIDAWLGKPGSQPFGSIGKFAIAKILLKYEKSRFLFRDIVASHFPSADPDHKPKLCWYRQLYQAIDCPIADFHNNKLSVITFNYDRSLEHFIHTSLTSDNLDKSEDEIDCAASPLEVLHVHGQLGFLPWQRRPNDSVVPYDTDRTVNVIRRSATHIKIIHEASGLDDEFERARKLLMDAHSICIIGFGYDQTNLTRLGLQNLTSVNPLRTFAGTTMGLSNRQHQIISRYFPSETYPFFEKFDQTAYDFLYKSVILD